MKLLITLSLPFFLISCGTYTPLPSHGGGKRFAVEQMLVSAVSKKAISDLPIDVVKGKKVLLETSVVYDEGGGFNNGGRPYLNEVISNVYQDTKTRATSTTTTTLGASVSRGDRTYIKDLSLNNSDSRHFSNLLLTSLIRNNVLVNPTQSEGEPEYMIEVIVDILGTVRSKTDWAITNSENLKAIISLEYVISPLANNGSKRIVGTISYEAAYTEKYIAWMGPTETTTKVTKIDLSELVPTLGVGVDSYENLKRDTPKEFTQPPPPTPVQINPRAR